MQFSDIPTKFQIPFANGAGGSFIRPVPIPSQIGIDNGAASDTDGFPPLCFDPIGSGGFAPDGRDFNGILNQVSAWSRWTAAGGPLYYDGTWSTGAGGYPQGAFLQSASTPGLFWISLADNNTVNPDGGPSVDWLAAGNGMALVGDVNGTPGANVIGAGKVTGAKTANNTLTNANLVNMASATFKANNSGSAGPPLDLTVVQSLALLATPNISVFGTSGKIAIGVVASGVAITAMLQWGTYSCAANGGTDPVSFSPSFGAAPVAWVGVNNAASSQLGTTSITSVGMTIETGIDDNQPRTGTWFALGHL